MGTAAPGSVDAELSGLRSTRGLVLVCMTMQPDRFPACQSDPQARRLRVATVDARDLRFDGLPSGDYAIALIHDENGNRRMDKMMGVPREGFGFSRNPAIRFGPPSFSSARFAVGSGTTAERVRVKYLL